MTETIVAVLKEHKSTGYIITLYLAIQENEHFIELSEIITPQVYEQKEINSETIYSIVKSIDAYSNTNLSKIFGKKQTTHDFFKSLSSEFVDKHIRPFIEKQLTIIIDKILKAGIDLYLSKDKFNTLHKEDLIHIQKEPAKTIFNIIKGETDTKYFLSVKHKTKDINLYKNKGIILCDNPCMLIFDGNLFRFADINGKKLQPFFKKEFISIPQKLEKKWFETFAVNAMKKYTVKPKGFDIVEKKESFKAILVLEKDWKDEYAFLLFFNYGENTYQYGLHYDTKIEFDEASFAFIKQQRNFEAEEQCAEVLRQLQLCEESNGVFKIKQKNKNIEKQQRNSILFLQKHIEDIQEKGIEVKQNFFAKKYFTEAISLNLNAQESRDWFDIYGTAKFGKFNIPFIQLRENILTGNREFILPDSSIALIPETWFSKYADLFLFSDNKANILKIGKTHFNSIKKAELKGVDETFIKDTEKLLTRTFDTIEVPTNIQANLRSYQKEGYGIMAFLRDNHFGICLADDMGLGKTLQVITLIQDTINKQKSSADNTFVSAMPSMQLSLFENPEKQKQQSEASIIVMPISLLHNWDKEIKKFAPELKVLKYHGPKRQSSIRHFNNYDIILTGYNTLRNDIAAISKQHFLFAVLDESQFVKNSESKTYQAVMEIESQHKVVITGTPVENSLSDLWSQMNFINDGMLGNEVFFKETFIKPIEQDKDEIQTEKLKSLINPFIIRRTKKEVAKDLPELTEQIIYCVQDEEQKKIYETEKSKIRNILAEQIENKEKKKLSALALSALTKLRQIANHPVLTNSKYSGESGKFKEIIFRIESILAENHKILIFSSFVKHLDLFAKYFKSKDIKYAMLTGQTKNREACISSFQNDAERNIFLISLKAGGTGLNLTEADYVFILDPWWNPAVEKQAVNRAHRIGQKKHVIVYKYITENSVEEKILNLQNTKSELANTIVEGDNPLLKMSQDLILELFK